VHSEGPISPFPLRPCSSRHPTVPTPATHAHTHTSSLRTCIIARNNALPHIQWQNDKIRAHHQPCARVPLVLLHTVFPLPRWAMVNIFEAALPLLHGSYG